MSVSWFSYHCCFFSYMRRPYSLIHVLSSDDPRRWKGTYVGLLLRLPLPSLTTNNVSVILRMCLSFIHQRWQATMTIHFWSQLICDATIGIEFPESDASLKITGLKCCILTQNRPPRPCMNNFVWCDEVTKVLLRSQTSLFFALWFVFSTIHWSGRAAKNQEHLSHEWHLVDVRWS